MFDIDRETVIDDFYGWCSAMGNLCPVVCCHALIMLKEQEELLRKLQNDKDKLCLEVSELKHKFHDAPQKFVSQGVVDQIRLERDTALSQLEQMGKGLSSKMDDIVALLKEQEAKIEHLKRPDCEHAAT